MDLQAANARQGAAAVGDDNGDDDFCSAGRVTHACFHGVKVAAHKSGVFVAQGHINGRPLPRIGGLQVQEIQGQDGLR